MDGQNQRLHLSISQQQQIIEQKIVKSNINSQYYINKQELRANIDSSDTLCTLHIKPA